MALPIGPETGAVYTLVTSGQTAVFNDAADGNYVGAVTDVTGLDDADVRESGDELVEFDGGIHGAFYAGRRPITLSGQIVPLSVTDRNLKSERLRLAAKALRSDGLLKWSPTGGVPVQIAVRKQQPLRITGAWVKDYQLQLVAADPRIYSQAAHTANVNLSGAAGGAGFTFDLGFDIDFGDAAVVGQLTPTNDGDDRAYPTITLTGPMTNPVIRNATTGESIRLTYSLIAGEVLVIDTLNRTVLLNGDPNANRYAAIDFFNTVWWGLVPGTNDIRAQPFDYQTGANLKLDWRDTWL